MIHHVAVVRFRDDVTSEQRIELLTAVETLAGEGLASSCSYGLDAGFGSKSNADFALIAQFPDGAALRTYLGHEAHVRVVGMLRELATALIPVQFETS
jgi:hypothetical protein